MRDPYDVRVAFDDLPEYRHAPLVDCVERGRAFASGRPILGAVRSVLRKVRARRPTPLLPKLLPAALDTTADSFQIADYAVLGARPDAGELAIYERTWPTYCAFLRGFITLRCAPKLVRLDDPASYALFREERRVPYGVDLARRLDALEATFAGHAREDARLREEFDQHLADYHGQDVLGAGVVRAARDYAAGGVPISVGPSLRGKVECWQDGDEVCCTVRFLTPRGLALATTGAPVERYVDEVMSALSEDEVEAVLPVVGHLARTLGATTLLSELCRCASIFATSGQTSPMIYGMSQSQARPEMAALMALLQRCQQGDAQSCAEVRSMEAGGEPLLGVAARALARGQAEKALVRRTR